MDAYPFGGILNYQSEEKKHRLDNAYKAVGPHDVTKRPFRPRNDLSKLIK